MRTSAAIASIIAGVSMLGVIQRLARAIIPWLIPPVIVLALLTVFPALVTFLPNLMR